MKPDRPTNPADCDEAELTRLAHAALDASIDTLDGATLSRLNRARQQALETRQGWQRVQHWLPLGATACALLLAITLLPGLRPGQAPAIVEPSVEEAYYNGSAEDLELVEDLDLVLWLMDAEDHAS